MARFNLVFTLSVGAETLGICFVFPQILGTYLLPTSMDFYHSLLSTRFTYYK